MTDVYIDTELDLERTSKHLEACDWIGVDTEFMRESTYVPKLCLIQLITHDRLICIDPVALSDLGPFFAQINQTKKLKILHSSRQDSEVFYRACGQVMGPIFDTQIAAAFLGHQSQLGYASLVLELTGVELKKDQTRTNWARRPLRKEQIDYALDDVRHLPDLKIKLEEQLKKHGKYDWAMEAMDEYTSEEALLSSLDYTVSRLKGFKRLRPKEKSIARAIVDWREQKAKTANRPRKWILDDKQICTFAQQRSPNELKQIESAVKQNKAMKPAYLQELQAAIERGRSSSGHAETPADFGQRPTAAQDRLIKQLSQTVATYSKETGIAQDLIATQKDLAGFALGLPNSRLDCGWRAHEIGPLLRNIREQLQ